jgi:hypothetical protein
VLSRDEEGKRTGNVVMMMVARTLMSGVQSCQSFPNGTETRKFLETRFLHNHNTMDDRNDYKMMAKKKKYSLEEENLAHYGKGGVVEKGKREKGCTIPLSRILKNRLPLLLLPPPLSSPSLLGSSSRRNLG